ncbi:10127_t:CDS:1 [Funneliformis mosseae]|uniref:10127_t:CDS:1 n=1 Tax=Funneliformis mosseae TaxID=27381 RepID=A0A9N9BNS0_FUNMO|nr:10127_t:CDS:1 [Funneliformis mosseae]
MRIEIVLSVLSILLSVLSLVHITRIMMFNFNPFLHITCLIGSLVILIIGILDLVNSFIVIENYPSIYFLCTSLTSILACYIILQVGINFYQEYTFIRTLMIFAPIAVSMGVFGLSIFTAIRKIFNEDEKATKDFEIITYYLSLAAGTLSLIYGIFPLFSIKSQTDLRPQQTAVAIVHFFIVVSFFIANFVIYSLIILNNPTLWEMKIRFIQNVILLLIFPGCLFAPPRGLVKFIKRRVLGVEVLTIGGDYRPNMLPNDYSNTDRLTFLRGDNKMKSLPALPPLPPVSISIPLVTSPPTLSGPNSASPRSISNSRLIPNSSSPTPVPNTYSPRRFYYNSNASYSSNNTTNSLSYSVNSQETDPSFYLDNFRYIPSDGGDPRLFP